jgi:uncharacterized membrane protein
MRRFLTDESGNFTIMAAVGMLLFTVLGALAIDSISLYTERRNVQSAVDLASIAAVRDPSRAYELARDTLIEAGLVPPGSTDIVLVTPGGARNLIVDAGHYRADPAITPLNRFIVGGRPYNAVRVEYHQFGQLHLAQAWSSPPRIGASAIASATPLVAFAIGSRLARLDGGIANAILNSLLGTGLSLSVLDYQALAAADINAFDFLDAMALQLGVTVASYGDLLAMNVNRQQIGRALAGRLAGAAGIVATTIANASATTPTFPLSRLITLGNLGDLLMGQRPVGITAGLPALELLAATIGMGGDSHLSMNLTSSLSSLTGIRLELVVGEPLQFASVFAVGPEGTVTRTAQVRLRLVLNLLGTPILFNAGVTVPIYLEVAHAEARVSAATCPTSGAPNGTATLAVRPGLVRLKIGSLADTAFADLKHVPAVGDAELINALLIKVSGSANVEIAEPVPVAVPFSSAEIGGSTVKTVTTRNLAQSLTASLLSSLTLSVKPFGLNVGVITAAVKGVISPASIIDTVLIDVLDALGIGIGEADVRVYGVTCTHPVLVE